MRGKKMMATTINGNGLHNQSKEEKNELRR